MEDKDKLQIAWQAFSMENSLLQNYRILFMALEAALLTLGFFLKGNWIWLLAIIGWIIVVIWIPVCKAKGKDVDEWMHRITRFHLTGPGGDCWFNYLKPGVKFEGGRVARWLFNYGLPIIISGLWLSVVLNAVSPAAAPVPDDTMAPTGAVHAHDNMIWPPNNKIVTVTLDGHVIDELSMARDGSGIGISFAYLMIDGTKIILRDETTNLLGEGGSFNVTTEVKAVKGAEYLVELYAADTEPEDVCGPNSGLVNSTRIRVSKN